MIDFYDYNLEQEIDKIKNTPYLPYDLDFYSSRKIIHQVLDISPKTNIKAYTYHGILVTPYELQDFALLYEEPVLVNKKEELDYLLKKGADKNKTFCIGSLFVRYKEFKKIKQDENAKGTIVFPVHSCKEIDRQVNWEEYAQKLSELPDEYKPINICMYYNDLLKNRHLPFIKKGFNVYCAGHCNDVDFVDNFYEIIKHHKYTTTNIFGGSNMFYCIDLGLKPFVYGQDINIETIKGENFEELSTISGYNDIEKLQDCEYSRKHRDFFKENLPVYPNIEISEENIKNFKNKLGLTDRTPDLIIKKALIKYAKKQSKTSFVKKIKNFIFKREKEGNKRKVTIFNFIKISYYKNSKKRGVCEHLKQVWEDVEKENFETFKNSDMIKNLNEKSVCIDCGANVGVITELFASKDAEVYAFEPYKPCYDEIVRKFGNNNKIHVYNAGVLDKNSKMKLYKFEHQDYDDLFFSQGASLYASNEEINKNDFVEVDVIDICEFIKNLNKPVDILKIDIEGAEFDVLNKLIDMELYKNIKHILVEDHSQTIPEIREKAECVKNKITEKEIKNIRLDWV